MAHCEISGRPCRKRQLTWILTTLVVVFCLDQATKELVRTIYPLPEGRPYFHGQETRFFYFTHQQNPGLVGGLFSNRPAVVFAAPILAVVVLIYLFKHLDPGSFMQSMAYGLLGGGALGNLVDRVARSGVTDFLQFNFYFVPFDFPWKHYPAFNIADSAICVGVGILIVTGWGRREQADVPDTG